jgi:hypothetical protein
MALSVEKPVTNNWEVTCYSILFLTQCSCLQKYFTSLQIEHCCYFLSYNTTMVPCMVNRGKVYDLKKKLKSKEK